MPLSLTELADFELINNGPVRLSVGASIPELAGKAILLAPAVDRRDRVQWFCVPVGIPDRFLPKSCRTGTH